MTEAAILDDPRPLGQDYAVGYTRDLFGDPSPLPFVSLGGIAPAGSGLASATDMARYLITQMRSGLEPHGRRVVSATNLDRMHRPGILLAPDALGPTDFRPDTVSLHYGMGWLSETYRNGHQLVWHSGGIDGFDSLIGFLPEAGIGFVVLTNSDLGAFFYTSVQASLLSRLFGLNPELPALMATVFPQLEAQTVERTTQTRSVDPAAIAPYLGLYEDGFQVRVDDTGGLYLDHDIRSMPMRALSEGSYVVAAGPQVVLEQHVTFTADDNGVPVMTIAGFEPVRWLTGG
jgi:CubicO group peptidase (beta-lactamase class C family)